MHYNNIIVVASDTVINVPDIAVVEMAEVTVLGTIEVVGVTVVVSLVDTIEVVGVTVVVSLVDTIEVVGVTVVMSVETVEAIDNTTDITCTAY